jgi:Tfp pilus assembly protein PilF
LGIIFWQTGKFDDAAQQLREVVRLKPDYAEAFYTLGTVYKQAGKLPEAAEALRKALRLQPDFAGAHTTLAAVLRQQGDQAGAATESKLGAEMVQQKMTLQAATFNTNSGMRLLNAGDVDGAISQFENAIKADGSYAPAHQQLALALERKGEKDRAQRELQLAKQLQSGDRR